MITFGQLLNSPVAKELLAYGVTQIPVYARINGELYQIDAVDRTQITSTAGATDIVVLDVHPAQPIVEE